jgi:hypothetical protein
MKKDVMIAKWLPYIFMAIILGLIIFSESIGQEWNGITPPTPPLATPPAEPKPEIAAPKHPPVEIFVKADRLKFIGGQNIVFKADVVFYQHVNPFWEELSKIKFSPFKVEKFVLGEWKIFDRDRDLNRDFREATFLLSLPLSSPCGIYTVPSFSLNYSYFDGKKEIKETAKSKLLKIEKVPVLINFGADKDAVTIGEINTFRLVIWREKYIRILNYELESAKDANDVSKEDFKRWLKSLEVRGQKITDLNKPVFGKFKVLSLAKKVEAEGNISKEIFEYRFSFYEKPGKIESLETSIPDFRIWYLDESQKEKQQPKEIATFPQYIITNSVLNPRRQSIEWLKEPKRHSEKSIYYFGYTLLALGGLLFVIFGISVAVDAIRSRKKYDIATEIYESPAETWLKLSNLQKERIDTDGQAKAILRYARNEFARMLGGILEIPANLAMAKTGTQIAEAFGEKGFSEDLAKKIKSCFSFFDRAIQTCEIKQDAFLIREMWNQINEISDSPEISKFLKKRKFRIFRK